jgi:glycosyltransferase involved in cell wall biosynthesis
MARLRVVTVMPEAPDPFANAASRWYYVLLKGLADRGHDVRAYAAYTRIAYADAARARFAGTPVRLELFPYPDRGGWWGRKWATLRRPYSHFIHSALSDGVTRALQDGCDILHLEQTWAGWLGIGKTRALLSVHWLAILDLQGTGFRSWEFFKAKLLSWYAERNILRQFKHIRVLTDRLASGVRRINPDAQVYVVPFAIDPTLYPMVENESQEKVVGLIAGMTWEPGYNAAVRLLTSIWGRVRMKEPDARLVVAGWEARKMLRRFVNEPGVSIVENLPDPLEFYRRCTVLAYPLARGSGMKVKILEAMAYGVPIVTTSEGIEGVDAENGTHAALEDEDEPFAERVVEMLRDPSARRCLREAGRVLVEEKYSPKTILPQIEEIYQQMLRA